MDVSKERRPVQKSSALSTESLEVGAIHQWFRLCQAFTGDKIEMQNEEYVSMFCKLELGKDPKKYSSKKRLLRVLSKERKTNLGYFSGAFLAKREATLLVERLKALFQWLSPIKKDRNQERRTRAFLPYVGITLEWYDRTQLRFR